MIINLLFLVPLFIVGIICSYTDVKYGKIKNKWIGLGLGWAVVLYVSLVAYNYFYLHQPENFQYLLEMLTNGVIALVIGYLLWNFKLLAAGDAKLFTLYAFLIPPEFYSKSYFLLFPSFVLLINIFLPLLLLLGTKALIFALKNAIKKSREIKGKELFTKEKLIEFWLKILKIFRVYTTFILIFVLLQIILRETTKLSGGLIQGPFSVYLFVFLFFIYRFLFTFISKHKFINLGVTLVGVVAVIYLLVTQQIEFLLGILKLALIFMILVTVANRLLGFYVEQREVRKIRIRELKEGMFLSLQETKDELKQKLGSMERTGLTKEQVETIKTFFPKNPEQEIKIYKTFALAPFILLGAVITILTKNSFIGLILWVFHFLF